MFITGPQVIKQVTGEVVSAEELGGPQAHMNKSGVVHLIAQDDEEAAQLCRRLLSFMPSNNVEDPPRMAFNLPIESDPEMNGIVPVDNKAAYDVRGVITRVVDYQDFFEIQPGFAPNIVIGFGRLQGRPVGIDCEPAECLAGVLDINASDKSARFVRFCNAFNIPLVTFVDVPGFLPGVEQERGGIIRHGAKLLFAYSAATVPKITVVLRKAYGGAYHRHVLQGTGRGPCGGVAHGRDCGDGRRGRGGDRLPAEIDAAEDKAGRRKELVERVSRDVFQPLTWRQAGVWWTTSSIRRTPGRLWRRLLESLHAKRELRPPERNMD
jgi:methylmalonyl-CoA carboxyltransferase large subunit